MTHSPSYKACKQKKNAKIVYDPGPDLVLNFFLFINPTARKHSRRFKYKKSHLPCSTGVALQFLSTTAALIALICVSVAKGAVFSVSNLLLLASNCACNNTAIKEKLYANKILKKRERKKKKILSSLLQRQQHATGLPVNFYETQKILRKKTRKP